jgi:hypothetical protein
MKVGSSTRTRSLRCEDLWGVWELRSIQEYFSDGECCVSSEVTGYLTYERDSASVVVGLPHHIHLDAGQFTVSDNIVEHDFELSLYPDWPRGRFMTRAELRDRSLLLRTTPTVCADGRTLYVAMGWARLGIAQADFGGLWSARPRQSGTFVAGSPGEVADELPVARLEEELGHAVA